MTVDVALPLPRLAPFSYSVPENWKVDVGCRVLVPLGKRIVTGMVVRCSESTTLDVKPILEVLDDRPSLPADVLELTRRTADYYLSSWGETIAAALPTGLSPSSVVRISLNRIVSDFDLDEMAVTAPKRSALVRTLRDLEGDVSVSWLQKKMGTTSVADQIDALQAMGWIDVSSAIEGAVREKTTKVYRPSDSVADDGSLRDVLGELERRAPKQALLFSVIWLAAAHQQDPPSKSILMEIDGASESALLALERKGYIVADVVPIRRHTSQSASATSELDLPLHDEQRTAVESICAAMARASFSATMMEGITGSGKTLVYLHAVKQCLETQKTALILVPEISLTPQLGDRFRAAFGDTVAILHSRLAIGERARIWRSIRDGEVKVVLGARSAVFAPLENVGLIIVDEEHEPSYKQDDPAPRYHGRDVAVLRASLHQCPIILGSATPSLETVVNVRNKRYDALHLTHRADGAVLPNLHVVDLREMKKTQRLFGSISAPLADAIRLRLARKEGTILFLNRRGYSPQLQCLDCGESPTCPNCDVQLTYHKIGQTVRCHYCGYNDTSYTACRVCGSTDLGEIGTGTQRIEEDVKGLFEGAVVERLDADSTTRRNAHRDVLTRFERGDIDIIVGTQMIAKGLDIGRVTLVGIVNADQSLFQADFRAAERTAQLIVQVAGRAGRRADQPGDVIIQTRAPENVVIQSIVNGTYQQLLDAELVSRRAAGYPPYTRFIVIEVSGFDVHLVEDRARVLEALIPRETDFLSRSTVVVPSIAWIRNRHRRVIVIKNHKTTDPTGALCRSLLKNAMNTYYDSHATSAVKVTVDIDASGRL